VPPSRRPRHRATTLAFAWALAYGLLATLWAAGVPSFPFGRGHDPDPDYSNLAALTPETGAPVIAFWAVLAAAAAALMGRDGPPRRLAAASVAVAWITAGALLLIVPDFRVLIRVAYLPVVLLGAPFNWPPGVDLSEFFQWTVLNQFLCVGGGIAFASAALRGQRRLAGACETCGRSGGTNRWTSPEAAARWGAWATWIAVLLPLFYSVTRWAWALGIPLGVTSDFLREEAEETPMIWYAGAFLATIGALGGLLTLGLIRPWGERFPRWMGRLAGRRVPPRLAIVPASVIAILILETGIMYNRMALTGVWDEDFRTGNWGTVLPEMTWPLWGLALGAATLAYHYRRRGRCEACGLV
jgi:hypothetical protein